LTITRLEDEAEKLTKTDEVLVELTMAFVAFLKSFFPFEYDNKTYRLVNNYVASPWIRCDVCGNYPIQDVSVIRSSDGKELRIGNKCIDQITGRGVSEWFKQFKTNRENVMANRKYIDQLSLILDAHDRNRLSFQITDGDVETLRAMLDQMCNGLNLTTGQEQIAECYISRKATA
jgi:hypothetical protein